MCGTLNPSSNTKVGYYFAYNKGASCTGGKETPLQAEQQGEHVHVSGELFGLEADTQYAVCLIATDSSGETTGQILTITTEPAAPKPPQTGPATNITTDSATLEGKLSSQPIATSWYFQYAPQFTCTWEHASTTAEEQDTKPGEVDEVSAAVSNLQPGAYYNVCLVAKNRIGSTVGWERSFLTEATAPKIESVSAQSTSSEATIEAKTNPDAQTATCDVQYGTSEAYGSTASCKEGLGNNGERTSASAHISNLAPGTTYYFQVIVNNEVGKSLASEGKGTVTTQPLSTPGGSGGEEKTSTPPANNPITSTLSTTPAWWLPITSPSEPEPKPPKAKPLTRAQKLTKALKACKRKPKKKRTSCLKQARMRYGAAEKKSK